MLSYCIAQSPSVLLEIWLFVNTSLYFIGVIPSPTKSSEIRDMYKGINKYK